MLVKLGLTIPIAVFACVVAALIGWVLIKKGPRDAPGGECHKIHTQSNPTAGGIAVFASVVPLSLVLVIMQPDWLSPAITALLFGASFMFLMGLWDDLISLPPKPKLVAQIVISLIVTYFGVRVASFDAGRHVFEVGLIVGMLGTTAWFVVVTNAVNFMDGSDGLAMGSCAVIAAGLSLLAAITGVYDIAALSLVLLGAILGLLFWNGRGRLFAGDTGALFVGFYLAGLTILWIVRLNLSVWIAPTFFIAFLSDVLLTLIWRYKHRRNLLQGHREHVYQIALRAGLSHPLVAWVYAWTSMHGLLIGGVSVLFPGGGSMIGFLILLAIIYLINRKVRRSALENGFLKAEAQ